MDEYCAVYLPRPENPTLCSLPNLNLYFEISGEEKGVKNLGNVG
jgi:hypothetical protein